MKHKKIKIEEEKRHIKLSVITAFIISFFILLVPVLSCFGVTINGIPITQLPALSLSMLTASLVFIIGMPISIRYDNKRKLNNFDNTFPKREKKNK